MSVFESPGWHANSDPSDMERSCTWWARPYGITTLDCATPPCHELWKHSLENQKFVIIFHSHWARKYPSDCLCLKTPKSLLPVTYSLKLNVLFATPYLTVPVGWARGILTHVPNPANYPFLPHICFPHVLICLREKGRTHFFCLSWRIVLPSAWSSSQEL